MLHCYLRSQRSIMVQALCIALVSLIAQGLLYRTVFAANPPPVQVYYVPLPEDQVYEALKNIFPDVNVCPAGENNTDVVEPIETYISVSVLSDDTVIYYDHWEDGFEVDISSPQQASTEIWGDGNPANGAPPASASDVISANSVLVLSSSVFTDTRQTVLDFDGGDKLASSKTVAVTRAAWSTGPSTLLAGALEAYPVDKWGFVYEAPIGVNVTHNLLFEYTALAVMASDDGTLVDVDTNGDGTIDDIITLDEGESHLVQDGVQAGAVVSATAPVQVALVTGKICDNYQSRWYVLFPKEMWSHSHYSPVSTPDSPVSTPADDPTTVFLYNPASEAISVTWETTAGIQPTITVAGKATSFVTMPTNSGAHFYSQGLEGSPQQFTAIAAVDTDAEDSKTSDWGFTLIPERQLTPQTLIGWGPGKDPLSDPGLVENGSPVWVMPVLVNGANGPITICADYDGDNAGPLTDAFGLAYDELLTLNEFENAKIFDDDGDQTGMIVYVCDPDAPAELSPAKLVAAWGQSPDDASSAEPGLDLGTTAPPAGSFAAGKSAELLVDADEDGLASPGDTLQYSVIVRNASRTPIETVRVSDTIPIHTTYVVSSTFVDRGSGAEMVADNGEGTAFPLDEGGIELGELTVLGVISVTFQVLVDDPFPAEVDRVRNIAIVTALDEMTRPEVETPIDLDPELALVKYVNGEDANVAPGILIQAGVSITWTYVVTNTGIVTISDVTVTDNVTSVTPVFVSGDIGEDGLLGPSETWIYTATGASVSGAYSNTGTVTGVGPDGDVVQASDPSHYFGVSSGVDLAKVVSETPVATGTPVTYSYAVSNTGNISLTVLALGDDQCAPVTAVVSDTFNVGDVNRNDGLDVGEIWPYTCAVTVTASITNVATVEAIDPLSNTVTATATAFVQVISPRISLEKTVSDAAVESGTVVTYSFTVSNTGPEQLFSIVLTDNLCSPLAFVGVDDGDDNSLTPGEQWSFTCVRTIMEDTLNTATVQAVNGAGTVVSDTASVFVDVFNLFLPIIWAPPPPEPPEEPCPPPDGCPVEGVGQIKALTFHEGLNQLFVVSRDPNRVLAVDARTNEVLASADTGPEPWGIDIDEASGLVYVSNFAGGDVWIYDVVSLALRSKVTVGTNPSLVEYLPGVDRVFVLVRGSSQVAIFEGETLLESISAGGSGPFGIAGDTVNQRVYISHRDSRSMSLVRQLSGSWQAQIGPQFGDDRSLFELAYNSNTGKLYVVHADGANSARSDPAGVWYVDIWEPRQDGIWGHVTQREVPSSGLPSSPEVGGAGIEVNPSTNNVFNVNTGANSLSVIDGLSDGIIGSVELGEDPFDLAINSQTNLVVVGLRASGHIVKIEDTY